MTKTWIPLPPRFETSIFCWFLWNIKNKKKLWNDFLYIIWKNFFKANTNLVTVVWTLFPRKSSDLLFWPRHAQCHEEAPFSSHAVALIETNDHVMMTLGPGRIWAAVAFNWLKSANAAILSCSSPATNVTFLASQVLQKN